MYNRFSWILKITLQLKSISLTMLINWYSKNYISYQINDELQPDIYIIKGLSEVLRLLQRNNGPQIEHVDFNMKTNLFLVVVPDSKANLGFDESTSFNTELNFTPGWNFEANFQYNRKKEYCIYNS